MMQLVLLLVEQTLNNFTYVLWMLHQVGLCEIDLAVMWVLFGKEPPPNTVVPLPNVQRGRNAQTQMERSGIVLKNNAPTFVLTSYRASK